jgi:hypothetical protein
MLDLRKPANWENMTVQRLVSITVDILDEDSESELGIRSAWWMALHLVMKKTANSGSKLVRSIALMMVDVTSQSKASKTEMKMADLIVVRMDYYSKKVFHWGLTMD